MDSNYVNVRVTVENVGFVRADRLQEGQLIVRRDMVARVDDVSFTGHDDDVVLRLQYQHADGPDGRERFFVNRYDEFPALRVVLA